MGCKEILLSVSPDNDAAKVLDKTFGFHRIKVDPEYFGKGHTREIMLYWYGRNNEKS